jgi:hypothetical protein
MTQLRRIAAVTFATTLLAAVAAAAAIVQVGAPVTVVEPTPIAAILATPADHVGRTVRVEGEVSGVCTREGCWMDIADEQGRRLRIKVEDGVLVFPAESRGQRAVAQGKVTVQELSREQYVAWQKHLAGEGGEPFDESKVGTGPFRLVQLAGDGAVIGE